MPCASTPTGRSAGAVFIAFGARIAVRARP